MTDASNVVELAFKDNSQAMEVSDPPSGTENEVIPELPPSFTLLVPTIEQPYSCPKPRPTRGVHGNL